MRVTAGVRIKLYSNVPQLTSFSLMTDDENVSEYYENGTKVDGVKKSELNSDSSYLIPTAKTTHLRVKINNDKALEEDLEIPDLYMYASNFNACGLYNSVKITIPQEVRDMASGSRDYVNGYIDFGLRMLYTPTVDGMQTLDISEYIPENFGAVRMYNSTVFKFRVDGNTMVSTNFEIAYKQKVM